MRLQGHRTFGSLGLGIFGTGTIVAVLQNVGTYLIESEDLKMLVKNKCKLFHRYFRTAPPILSVPGLFLRTSDSSMLMVREKRGGSQQQPQ